MDVLDRGSHLSEPRASHLSEPMVVHPKFLVVHREYHKSFSRLFYWGLRMNMLWVHWPTVSTSAHEVSANWSINYIFWKGCPWVKKDWEPFWESISFERWQPGLGIRRVRVGHFARSHSSAF